MPDIRCQFAKPPKSNATISGQALHLHPSSGTRNPSASPGWTVLSPWPALSAFLHEPNRSNAPADGCGGWFRELLPVSLKRPVFDKHRNQGSWTHRPAAICEHPKNVKGRQRHMTSGPSRRFCVRHPARNSAQACLRCSGSIAPAASVACQHLSKGTPNRVSPGSVSGWCFPASRACSCVCGCWTIERPIARHRSARTSSSPAPRLFAVYPTFLDPASKIGCLVNGIAIRSRLAGIADNFDFDAGLDQPV